MRDEGRGVRVEGERLIVKEEGSGGELGSDLDPDPWKILWIRIQIQQNDAEQLDPDPQHWLGGLAAKTRGQYTVPVLKDIYNMETWKHAAGWFARRYSVKGNKFALNLIN